MREIKNVMFKENTMRNSDVMKCLAFLESMIEKHPENAEMIKAYTRIIENKYRF